ncbi:DUF6477 family protein [Paracoccus suum]|uniref:DUF6477 family protein n=1 Tax=Paracoccus suum TaxID=2259340 RepID=UPI0018EFAB5C|nr:DUF6477 family protein [Paracoccus suum]
MLIRAARAGQASWRRARDLPRLMRVAAAPSHAQALAWLRIEEARLDAARRERSGHYMLDRHITVLIALLAEMGEGPAETRVVTSTLAGAAILPFRGPFSDRGTGRPERL